MKKYFQKGIDFLCDICYTVITEEQRASKRGAGTGDILIPGIPDSTERCLSKTTLYGGLRQWAVEKLPKTKSENHLKPHGGHANGLLKNHPKDIRKNENHEDYANGLNWKKNTKITYRRSEPGDPKRFPVYGG